MDRCIPYTPDEPFVMSGPKIRRFGEAWQLFYIAGRRWKVVDGRPEPVYKIRMATSPDGITWTKHGEDLIESRVEPDEAQASPDVLLRRRRLPHVLLLPVQQRLPRQGVRLPDRLRAQHRPDHWQRDDDQAGIDVSDGDGWDAEMVSYPHVFEVDGRTYMAYLGNEVGRFGFGLAELEGRASHEVAQARARSSTPTRTAFPTGASAGRSRPSRSSSRTACGSTSRPACSIPWPRASTSATSPTST